MHRFHVVPLILLGFSLTAATIVFGSVRLRESQATRAPTATDLREIRDEPAKLMLTAIQYPSPAGVPSSAKRLGGTKKPGIATKGEPFREEEGELTRGDETLANGEYVDYYTLEAKAGETLIVTLESEDFDTYLLITSSLSDEYVWENDDYQNLTTRSQIEFAIPEDGEYTIAVTSYDAEERGDYTLTFSRVESRIEAGELVEGDDTLENGEYIDWYEVEGRPGEMIVIDLASDDFDAYLIFEDAEQERFENDDWEDTTNSHLESNMFEDGIHRIGVTSYEAGETGRYDLKIAFREGVRFEEIERSGRLSRKLEGDESTLADGSLADGYLFWAEEDDTIVISMESDDFDTFLMIRGPEGMDDENDDFEGATNSRIAFRCRKSGRYQLLATSYRAGETGDYTLNIDLDASKYEAGKWAVGDDGRVFGVFVGIADYPDDTLEYCDQDARRIYDVFKSQFRMRAENARLLENSAATPENVREAIRDIMRRTDENDMFVLFYSGHGNQKKGEADEFDPDGNDETLSLYNGELTDNELADLLNEGDPGTCMVILDSCYSGGFAKDVVCRPGRLGFFSSEGDCLSVVADKDGAGGYLSLFFYQALHKDRRKVDLNDDHMLTVHELSYYLQEQFEQVVQGARTGHPSQLYPTGPIDPGNDLGYQRILSDRDGVSPHLILLDW